MSGMNIFTAIGISAGRNRIIIWRRFLKNCRFGATCFRVDAMQTNGPQPDVYQAGLDVGSTTAKLVVLDHDGTPWITKYRRHGSDVVHTLAIMLEEAVRMTGDVTVSLTVSGSAGMGLAEKAGLPFIQEVIAAGDVIRRHFPDAAMMIDIGGEDSKMMFLPPNRPP